MLFKRKNKKPDSSEWSNTVASKIAGYMLSVQEKVSTRMNKIMDGIGKRKLKVMLLIFCVIWGGLSIYFIGDGVFRKKIIPAKIQPIKIPAHMVMEDPPITNTELVEQIRAYKQYMDSAGLPIRPGLLDSINIIEQLYITEKK